MPSLPPEVAELQFHLDLDQTQVLDMVRQLDEVLVAWREARGEQMARRRGCSPELL